MKNKFENLKLKVFQLSKDCLALLNKLSFYQKIKLCLFALVSFGFLEKIESLVGVFLEQIENLDTSTQNKDIEIKSLKEQLSEHEKEINSLKKEKTRILIQLLQEKIRLAHEKEINFLTMANQETLKRYGVTAVGIGLAYFIGLNSVYSEEIRQMFQIVYDNRVALVTLVNLLRPFITLNQSNTQNRPNTDTPQPQLILRNGEDAEDAPDAPGVD